MANSLHISKLWTDKTRVTVEINTLTSTMSWTCLFIVLGSGGLTPAIQSANTTGFVGVEG